MLAAHGAVLSDERLQTAVLDWRKMRIVEGRVLVHGEDELGSGTGRHYFLLEGIDARVHMVYYTADLEHARAQGKLAPNSFVRLRKRFESGRPLLDVESLGSAEAILRDRLYLESTARVLARRGIMPAEDGWGWLVRALSGGLGQDGRRSEGPSREPPAWRRPSSLGDVTAFRLQSLPIEEHLYKEANLKRNDVAGEPTPPNRR